MIPTVFIARSFGNTWIHEYHIYVSCKYGSHFWTQFALRATSSFVIHASFTGNIYTRLFPDGPYSEYNHIASLMSQPFAPIERNLVSYKPVYMDDAFLCPFCGCVDVGGRRRKKDTARDEQWSKLLFPRDEILSDAEIAIRETIANVNKDTLPFKYRLCDTCRKLCNNPIASTPCPERCLKEGISFHHWPDSYKVYERIAERIPSDKDRAAWWETKLICHNKRISRPVATCIKKAIERRMRRKHLTAQEHKALAMMLAGSTIRNLLKTA